MIEGLTGTSLSTGNKQSGLPSSPHAGITEEGPFAVL